MAQIRRASERPARERREPVRFVPQDYPEPRPTAQPIGEQNVLAEIEALEMAWLDAVQPASQIEIEICGQLAQASWHLQQLRVAERLVLQEAVRNRAFNGERGLRLMEWRRSTEESIRTLLSQIQILREGPRPAHSPQLPMAPQLPEATSDLLALAASLTPGRARQARVSH